MAENQNDRQIDAVLDAMLATYSAAEPRPGFETRIRARLRAHSTRHRRRTLTFVFAGSLAAMILVVWVAKPRSSAPPVDSIVVNRPPQTPVTGPLGAVPGRAKASGLEKTPRVRLAKLAAGRHEALLRVADLVHNGGSVAFDRERLYTQPAPQAAAATESANQAAEAENQSAAPGNSIQDLRVPSLEIKELTPTSPNDEKGNL